MSKVCLLLVILVILAHQVCWGAAGLIQQVPAKDPAYAQLRLLDKCGMLPPATITAAGALTRYDFALAVIEPLRQIVALTDAQDVVVVAPEQRRRQEKAAQVLSQLAPAEIEQFTIATGQLLQSYKDIIEELSPGLPRQATIALAKLPTLSFATPHSATTDDDRITLRYSFDPRAVPETFANPLPLVPAAPGSLSVRALGKSDPLVSGNMLSVRPVSSLEAAVNVAFRRFRVYGSVATLPGQDPMQLLVRPEIPNGRALLGFEINFGHLNTLGITGMLEYHIQRTSETGIPSTDIGAVTGIGIAW